MVNVLISFLSFRHHPSMIEDAAQAINSEQKVCGSPYHQEFDDDGGTTSYHLEYDELIGQMGGGAR